MSRASTFLENLHQNNRFLGKGGSIVTKYLGVMILTGSELYGPVCKSIAMRLAFHIATADLNSRRK